MYTKEENNRFNYSILKLNLRNDLSRQTYSDVFPISNRSSIGPYPGVIIYQVADTSKLGASFSENIAERLTQLLKEPNTKNISRYFYTYVDDYNQMVNCRYNMRTYISFREFDQEGITPKVI